MNFFVQLCNTCSKSEFCYTYVTNYELCSLLLDLICCIKPHSCTKFY